MMMSVKQFDRTFILEIQRFMLANHCLYSWKNQDFHYEFYTPKILRPHMLFA